MAATLPSQKDGELNGQQENKDEEEEQDPSDKR